MIDPPRGGTPRFHASVLWNCLNGSRPFASQKYFHKEARALLTAQLTEKKHDLVIADHLLSWIHFADLKPDPQVPTIVLPHIVAYIIWKRHVEDAAHPLRRWICAVNGGSPEPSRTTQRPMPPVRPLPTPPPHDPRPLLQRRTPESKFGHLPRKPGVFANYRWREELFPAPAYRAAYDHLTRITHEADRL